MVWGQGHRLCADIRMEFKVTRAVDSRFPHEFIGFWSVDGRFPYEFIGFRG